MMESRDKVDLRIRFAGLCLFVPDRVNKVVHVLMPPTGAGSTHHGHHAHGAVEEHQICIYWVSNGKGDSASIEGKNLVLKGPGWREPDLEIKGVFHLGKVKPSGECPENSQGKADPERAAARMELHAGDSKVINKGARWKLPKDDTMQHPMPTVLDWRVTNVSPADVEAMLRGWGLFDALPDIGEKNTINLWVLHLPRNEQKPWQMTSTPDMQVGNQHFPAYYSLLVCHEHYDALPVEPEPEDCIKDEDRPEWPVRHAAEGMLVTCMVAKADLA